MKITPLKITIVGGGPAGLYLALLLKKADSRHAITIYERNKPNDTFGFGVVFSDETLSQFLAEDADTHQAIKDHFAYWNEIDVVYGDETIRSTAMASAAWHVRLCLISSSSAAARAAWRCISRPKSPILRSCAGNATCW